MAAGVTHARSLANARSLQQRMVATAHELQEAAERAAAMCEQHLDDNPGAPDADEWEARAKYWRRAGEQAVQIALDWEAGPLQQTGPPHLTGAAEPLTGKPLAEVTATSSCEQAHEAAARLADIVIKALFGTGLELQAVMSVAPESLAARLGVIVEGIDGCIREIRHVILDLSE